MTELTRRDFLRTVALAAVGAVASRLPVWEAEATRTVGTNATLAMDGLDLADSAKPVTNGMSDLLLEHYSGTYVTESSWFMVGEHGPERIEVPPGWRAWKLQSFGIPAEDVRQRIRESEAAGKEAP